MATVRWQRAVTIVCSLLLFSRCSFLGRCVYSYARLVYALVCTHRSENRLSMLQQKAIIIIVHSRAHTHTNALNEIIRIQFFFAGISTHCELCGARQCVFAHCYNTTRKIFSILFVLFLCSAIRFACIHFCLRHAAVTERTAVVAEHWGNSTTESRKQFSVRACVCFSFAFVLRHSTTHKNPTCVYAFHLECEVHDPTEKHFYMNCWLSNSFSFATKIFLPRLVNE